MTKNLRKAIPAVIPVLIMGIVGWILVSGGTFSPHSTPKRPHVSESRLKPLTPKTWYNGVAIGRLDSLARWESVTGERPNVVQVYVALGDKFPVGEISAIEHKGALPIVQIDIHTPVSNIASYAAHLREWRTAILKTKLQIMLSFGHEMNGPWFSWGCTHTTPYEFKKAWRYLHTALKTPYTRWMYTVNRTKLDFRCGPMQYYPGDAYVNWIGIDGYYRHAGSTFSGTFGLTIHDIRQNSQRPILLSEVGVLDFHGAQHGIRNLYAGARRTAGIIGIVYFDAYTPKGDYRPQDDPAALVTFKKSIQNGERKKKRS